MKLFVNRVHFAVFRVDLTFGELFFAPPEPVSATAKLLKDVRYGDLCTEKAFLWPSQVDFRPEMPENRQLQNNFTPLP